MNRLLKYLLFITGIIILVSLFDFRLYENMENQTACDKLNGCDKAKISAAINYLKTKLPEKLKKKLENLNSKDISEEKLFSLAEEFKKVDTNPKDLVCGEKIAKCYKQ